MLLTHGVLGEATLLLVKESGPERREFVGYKGESWIFFMLRKPGGKIGRLEAKEKDQAVLSWCRWEEKWSGHQSS